MFRKKKWYAVGPDDGEGWEAVQAVSTTQAKAAWKAGNYDTDYLIAQRVPDWDGLERITGPDWIAAGLSYTCASCGEYAGEDFDEHPPIIRAGEVFHAGCQS